MEIEVIKDLVKVANSLDQKGLYKESDLIDSLILKLASGSSRPGQDEIEKKVKEIRGLPDIRKGSTISDIEQMAEGEDLWGMREEFYSGWEDEDFRAVLDLLGEPMETEQVGESNIENKVDGKGERPTKGAPAQLGLGVRSLPQRPGGGVEIVSIVEGRATKLRVGDFILEVDGTPVASPMQLTAKLQRLLAEHFRWVDLLIQRHVGRINVRVPILDLLE